MKLDDLIAEVEARNVIATAIKNLTYYAFLFFFGFLVCYLWAHGNQEELARRIIELEAGNAVIEQLCGRR